jgi:RNA polymerase sigma factor (sigma-70 family)
VSSLRDHATSPTGALSKQQDQVLLLEALHQIPLEAQLVLELAYGEGLAGSEIAEVLGVSAAVVHTRLHRARESLRESIRVVAPDRIALAERGLELLRHEG